jgi:hypothetical protein
MPFNIMTGKFDGRPATHRDGDVAAMLQNMNLHGTLYSIHHRIPWTKIREALNVILYRAPPQEAARTLHVLLSIDQTTLQSSIDDAVVEVQKRYVAGGVKAGKERLQEGSKTVEDLNNVELGLYSLPPNVFIGPSGRIDDPEDKGMDFRPADLRHGTATNRKKTPMAQPTHALLSLIGLFRELNKQSSIDLVGIRQACDKVRAKRDGLDWNHNAHEWHVANGRQGFQDCRLIEYRNAQNTDVPFTQKDLEGLTTYISFGIPLAAPRQYALRRCR